MRLISPIWSLLLLLSPAVQAAILAIDYGAEFTKLSLVKPGVPFDVILDRDSKRKIQSVVGWKREDRVFGAEAKMSVSVSGLQPQVSLTKELKLTWYRLQDFQKRIIHI